jgi:hypothetical protein
VTRTTGGGAARAARAGPAFALLVPGGLAALGLVPAYLGGPQPQTGVYAFFGEASLTRVLYLGAPPGWPTAGFPLGWYWAAALTITVLATAAWYGRPDGTGQWPGALRGYLITGLILVALAVALPLTGLSTPMPADTAWAQWLSVLWSQGTFPLLAVAVTLAAAAGLWRSRLLGVVTAVYLVTVALAGLIGYEQTDGFFPAPNAAVLLPVAVLLLGGLGALLPALAAARRASQN